MNSTHDINFRPPTRAPEMITPRPPDPPSRSDTTIHPSSFILHPSPGVRQLREASKRLSSKRASLPTLRTRLDQLNWHRRNIGKRPLSYSDIARGIATISKSTVAAVIGNDYRCKTFFLHQEAIAKYIMSELEPYLPSASSAPSTQSIKSTRSTSSTSRRIRTPRLFLVRTNPSGYFVHRNRHYYAGPSGQQLVIRPIPRDPDHYIAIMPAAPRTPNPEPRYLRPINPAGNQLDYHPTGAAA